MKYGLIAFLLLSVPACTERPSSNQAFDLSDRDIIPGLASPIKADLEMTLIDLQDYVLDLSLVDSVCMFDRALEFSGREVHIHDWTSDMAMAPMHIWSQGEDFVIPVMRSRFVKQQFDFDSRGRDFSTVKLKGEITGWSTEEVVFEESDGIYSASFILEPGDYQYIMYIDGEELLDFNNAQTVENGLGGHNSVLSVGKPIDAPLWLSAVSDASMLALGVINKTPKTQYLALWEDQKLEVDTSKIAAFVSIPPRARAMERSHIRIWAYDDKQVSNDLLIPLHNGQILSDVAELNRHDKHGMTLYNVFVDRFYNGDPSNDRPIDSPEVHPRADDHGGDLRGAIDKLEAGYFDELGINTIWISPIVKNVEGAWGAWPHPATKFSAYHGYWPVSFTLIDDRKGSAAELHELVDKAHARGMNVLLDFVANHVHESHPFYQANPDLATDLYLPDGRLNTELWDEQRLTTWFDVFLPTLQLDRPEVYEMLSDSALYWIKEFDLDGFRHDATKHVPEIFWKTLSRKLKEEMAASGRSLYQIGETYGPPSLISGYVNSGQLDAQFDFNVYDAIVATLCQTEVGFERLDDEVKRSLQTYGHHHLMGNITGNQDRGRFLSSAGGALSFDENAKEAGWSREVGVGEDVAYDKAKLLMAITATLPGLPVIYYGDEIGSYGGNDPDNRKMMRFEGLSAEEASLKRLSEEVLAERRSNLDLLYGDFRSHHMTQETYVFSRNFLYSTTLLCFNNSADDKKVSFTVAPDQEARLDALTEENELLSRVEDHYTITLAPYSFKIINRP